MSLSSGGIWHRLKHKLRLVLYSVSAALFAFFCIPELKGKTLEEIDHCFQANLPARAFGSYKVPEKGADGSSLEKSEDVVAHKV